MFFIANSLKLVCELKSGLMYWHLIEFISICLNSNIDKLVNKCSKIFEKSAQ